MSETIPSQSDEEAFVGAYNQQGLPSSGTEGSADQDAGTGEGDGPSGWPDMRPLRDRSQGEQLDLASQRLKVSRSIGFLPSSEATWLFATVETQLDEDDSALMEQLSDLLRGIEAEDKIATRARKPDANFATTPERDVATAEANARRPAIPSRQGVAGHHGSPCAVAPPVSSLITTRPPASSQFDKGTSRTPNRQVLRWNRLPPNKRFHATIEAAARYKGLAVTLAFSAARERALMASTDPTRLLTHYLNRGLKAAGVAVPYSLRLEVSPEGRLHAHGVLIASGQAGADLGQLKAVLVSAAGKIQGRAGSKQCVFKDIIDANGWHSYLLKSHNKTAKALGTEKTSVISRCMLQIVRSEYESKRLGRTPG